VEVNFNNAGTVDVQTGTLSLVGDGTSSGTFTVPVGATLGFDGGTPSLIAGSNITSTGTVRFAGGTTTLAGTYNVTGITRSIGGQATFNSNGSTTQLSLEGGFVGGSGELTVTGAITWTAGGYNGIGHLRANGGIAITGPAPKQVMNGTLDNAALATWNDARPLQIRQGGTWNKLAAGTLEATHDAA